MPRIRQYAERDAMQDLAAEIRAQCSRRNWKQKDLAEAIDRTGRTVINYMEFPERMQIGMLQKMVVGLKLNPVIVLRALGYSTQDIKKLREYQ